MCTYHAKYLNVLRRPVEVTTPSGRSDGDYLRMQSCLDLFRFIKYEPISVYSAIHWKKANLSENRDAE